MLWTVLSTVCLSLLWACLQTDGLRLEGSLKTQSDWSFIERFCFKAKDGKLNFTIYYPLRYQNVYLLFYYDRGDKWENVYTSQTMTCQQKVSVLNPGSNQLMNLNLGVCETYQRAGETWYECEHSQKFSSSRDMWWFFVISRCENDRQDKNLKGINLTYKFHLTNGEDGDVLHHEFSADEFYILPIDIAFFIAYGFLISISVMVAFRLYSLQLLHSTYKLYLSSLIIWWIHLLAYVVAYGHYARTGYRLDTLTSAGRLFSLISIGIFILMLLLLANGYSVVIGKLKKKIKILVVLAIVFYYVATFFFVVVEGRAFDRGLVLYIYDFWPGYCLLIIRGICFFIFMLMLIFMLKKHRKKRRFYVPFAFLYTLWFWAGPVVILLAMFVMDDWAREKVVHGIEQAVMFFGHIFFLVLTRPTQASSNFPYTIKTSQISIMNSDDSEDRENVYEVMDSDTRKLDDIFQTSSQRSSSSSSTLSQGECSTSTSPL